MTGLAVHQISSLLQAASEPVLFARVKLTQRDAGRNLRAGAAAGHVVKVAQTEQADAIALAWSQRLDPGRALVVWHAILDAGVPVMLLPMAAN